MYDLLANGGYAVDFVGTQTSGSIPDPQHQGLSGWRADQIRDALPAWLVTTAPQIVLLHIGTNDISSGELAAGITAEIGQILDVVDTYAAAHGAAISVVVARIVNRGDALTAETSALNAAIAAMVAERAAAGDLVTVVDQETALTYPGDLADIWHPNASGYAKMAAVWYQALRPLLRNRGEFVGDTIPKVMIPGNAYACGVTMANAGHEAWSCTAGTRLVVRQTSGPAGGTLIAGPQLEVGLDPCLVSAGQQCAFAFTINVPAGTPYGQYEFAWQMRDDGEWFDSSGHDAVLRKMFYVRPYPFYVGDFDDDGDVDQDDFGHLQVCFSGVGLVQNDAACQDARLDGDRDVDTADLDLFRACMGGVNVTPGANCIR